MEREGGAARRFDGPDGMRVKRMGWPEDVRLAQLRVLEVYTLRICAIKLADCCLCVCGCLVRYVGDTL